MTELHILGTVGGSVIMIGGLIAWAIRQPIAEQSGECGTCDIKPNCIRWNAKHACPAAPCPGEDFCRIAAKK